MAPPADALVAPSAIVGGSDAFPIERVRDRLKGFAGGESLEHAHDQRRLGRIDHGHLRMFSRSGGLSSSRVA
jgi:hypothetical protein